MYKRRSPIPRMAAPKRQPEGMIVYECLRWLLDQGYYVWRNATGACKIGRRWMRFGFKGSGDIIGLTKTGHFLSVEVKSPKGRLRPEQAVFMARVNREGGKALVARSVADLKEAGL